MRMYNIFFRQSNNLSSSSLIIWISAFILLQLAGCNPDTLEPVEKDDTPPKAIVGAEAISLPGAAQITYQVPDDEDLLYVVAQYTNKQKKTVEVKASFYTNTLTVEGFGDTAVYEVKLYAVDRSENKSAPYTIAVKPLTPPVYKAFEALEIEPDFGGVHIKAINLAEADLAIVLLRKDSLGDYVIDDTRYTKSSEIDYSVRGYDSIQTSFALYVRDRWNNLSDTLFAEISPIYEVKLDKKKFQQVVLPSDVASGWGLIMPFLWDEIISGGWNMWHSVDVTEMPMHFTFDLGVTVKLSRFTFWQRPNNGGEVYMYGHGNPKRYKVYGSTNPAPDGSWDGWFLLRDECVSVKPSGLPLGVFTGEDYAKIAEGEEWNVRLDAPEVRYIRIEVLETWSGAKAAHIAEATFWGSLEQ